MSHSIDLKIRSLNEFGVGEGKEYHALVCIQDLLDANGNTEAVSTWKIPLEANVRRPTKNSVTDSIISSLVKGVQVISSPIHIAADCQKINTNLVKLTFRNRDGFSDGLLDGGHRLLSFCIASQQRIKLSEVFVNIIIYSKYDGNQLKDKAVALNTTKAVSKMSLANYSGIFDWMKPSLQGYSIVYYEGQLNERSHNGKTSTYTDGCCRITRIHQILIALDTGYSPKNIDDTQRHPRIALHSDRNMNLSAKTLIVNYLIHPNKLILTLLETTSKIVGLIWDKSSTITLSWFIKSLKDLRKNA